MYTLRKFLPLGQPTHSGLGERIMKKWRATRNGLATLLMRPRPWPKA